MAINKDIFKAILSMDAYNRGYTPGIKFGTLTNDNSIDTTGTKIGNASIISNKGDQVARDSGFYALAYNYNGEKIISIRGTDQRPSSSASCNGAANDNFKFFNVQKVA